MAKGACHSKLFVVGRKHKRVIHREVTSEPLPSAEEKKEVVAPGRGKKREMKLQRYLSSGLVLRSTESAEHLLDTKKNPDAVFTVPDCLDEAELRSHFPNKGIGHNFFMGKHSFRFSLADDNTTVVAQVIKTLI